GVPSAEAPSSGPASPAAPKLTSSTACACTSITGARRPDGDSAVGRTSDMGQPFQLLLVQGEPAGERAGRQEPDLVARAHAALGDGGRDVDPLTALDHFDDLGAVLEDRD